VKKYKISFLVMCLLISSLNYCSEAPKNRSAISNILSFFYQKFDSLCKFIFFKNFLQFKLDRLLSVFCETKELPLQILLLSDEKKELPKLTPLCFGTSGLTTNPIVFSGNSKTKESNFSSSLFPQFPKDVNVIIADFWMQLDRQSKDANSIARINRLDHQVQQILNNTILESLNNVEKKWQDKALLCPGYIGNKKEISCDKAFLVCSCISECHGKIDIYNNYLELIKTFNKVSCSGLFKKRSIVFIGHSDANRKERIIFYDMQNNKNFELPYLHYFCFSKSHDENMIAISLQESLELYDISDLNRIKKISISTEYTGHNIVFSQDDTLLALFCQQNCMVYLFSLDKNQLKEEAHYAVEGPQYSFHVEMFFMNNNQQLGLSIFGRLVTLYLNLKINKIKDKFEIIENFRREKKCVVAHDNQRKLLAIGTSSEYHKSVEDCDGNKIIHQAVDYDGRKIFKISKDGKYILDINTTKNKMDIVHLDENKQIKEKHSIKKEVINVNLNKDTLLILAGAPYQKESLTTEYMLYDIKGNEIKSWSLPKKDADVFFHPSGPIVIQNGDIYNLYDHRIDQKIKEVIAQELTVEYYSQLQ